MTRGGTCRVRSHHSLPWGIAASVSLLTGLGAGGCGGFVGPAAVVPTDGGKVSLGASGGYRIYPGVTRGLVMGGGVAFAPKGGRDRPWRAWADAQAGYGYQPVSHLSHWGVELTAGPAVGLIPDAGEHPVSLGWSWHAGAAYRISGTKKPWEMTEHVQLFSTLTP